MKKAVLRKWVSLLIALSLIISLAAPVYAKDDSIHVQLNGENLSFDVAPKMINNRILVPMRVIFERLGAKVEWDSQTGAITAMKDGSVIKLSVNSRDAVITKNGVQRVVKMDTPSAVVDGRTLVPIRFVSESLGKQVGWDTANRTVVIIDYDYFLNALKTGASNFYEFATNQYGVVNTGEVNGSGDITFKFNSTKDSSENVSGNIKSTFNAKIDEENGSMDATVKVTGLDDILAESGLEDVDQASFNIRFDNNSFYVKSNLFSLLERDNIHVGDKWIKADIADFGIPDVNTLQDLKKMQNQRSTDQIMTDLVNIPMELDVNSFAEAQKWFNALVTLVDNNHFTVVNQGDMKVYAWKMNKQDLIDVAQDILETSGALDNMTVEDMAELKQFIDSLVFDFSMAVEVKNNIIISNKTSLNASVDIPDEGHFEISLINSSEVLNPNNAHFQITIPGPNDVIDIEELASQEPSDSF